MASPALAVPNITANPSTASVPITVLMYNGILLRGFNEPIKALINLQSDKLTNPKRNRLRGCKCCQLIYE